MTHTNLKEQYPQEYERGWWDAVRFSYIKQGWNKEQWQAWHLGYQDCEAGILLD